MKATPYYLFASSGEKADANSVFYKVPSKELAKHLCDLFQSIHGESMDLKGFCFRLAESFPLNTKIILDEVLSRIESHPQSNSIASDPVSENAFSKRREYAAQAGKWHLLLLKELITEWLTNGGDDKILEKLPSIPPEEVRNGALNVLLLLAQAYYVMLESGSTAAEYSPEVDMQLNHYYLWSLRNLENLLKNTDFKDAPAFRPPVRDLLPSSIKNCRWSGIVATDAEGFLGAVQQYVMKKGLYEPEEGSPAWIMIKLFRPDVETAIKTAVDYKERMRLRMPRNASGNIVTSTKPAANPFICHGRLKFLPGDFNTVWLDNKIYDLRERAQARLCIRYLVEQEAFNEESARDFVKEIDPYVREQGSFQAAAAAKIQHYFNDSKGIFPKLHKQLIGVVPGKGRYYLKVS